MIRKHRFAEAGTNDPAEILKQLEEEKQKKKERADRFGIETKDMALEKKHSRMERFK